MSASLLTPERMLDIIPGIVTVKGTVESADTKKMSLRGYRFDKTDVEIPCMRDYELVRWKSSTPTLGFHNGRGWIKTPVGTHDVTILTRGESSRWYWTNDIEVSHIYISQHMLLEVANEAFLKDIESFHMEHRPAVDDPILSSLLAAYEKEHLRGDLGSEIYAQTLEIQICIHLIREYVKFEKLKEHAISSLSHIQHQRLQEFIDTNLASHLSIKDMAAVVDLSPSYFVRVFGAFYGTSPHKFVQARRLKKAEKLLSTDDAPLKAVAIECGFSDQSHMTRLFKERLLLTPKQYRENRRSKIYGASPGL